VLRTGASPSREDRNPFNDHFGERFAKRRPADRHDGIDSRFSHEVGRLTREEDLQVVSGIHQSKSMRKHKEALVGSSDPQALFIMIFSFFVSVCACMPATPKKGRLASREKSCLRTILAS
jgi:hypothetical protein